MCPIPEPFSSACSLRSPGRGEPRRRSGPGRRWPVSVRRTCTN